MIKTPFAMKWTILEQHLNALKKSTENEYLKSNELSAAHFSDVKYFVRIYPNGCIEEHRGKVGIYFNVISGGQKEVEAKVKFSVKSAGWKRKFKHTFDYNGYGWGFPELDGFFNKKKGFIAEGKCIIKVKGWLKLERANVKAIENSPDKTFEKLWKHGFEDFSLIVGKKEIKAHKVVLSYRSPIFAAIIDSNTKEGIENKVVITYFEPETVETAIKACYLGHIDPKTSIADALLLYEFCDKYEISTLCEYLEEDLYSKVTPKTVCEILKLTSEIRAPRLHAKCIKFFEDCMTKKIPVENLNLLGKKLLVKFVEFSFHH